MKLESFLNQSIFKILVGLSVFAYFLPEFGAYDKIGPQWLALSIINIFVFIYLIYVKKSFSFISELFSNKVVLFYSLFLIISLISIIKSENLPESIITFSNYFSIFFCFLNLIILNNLLINPIKFFVDLIFLMFLAEVWLTFYPMLKDFYSIGGVTARGFNYIGAASNINVTSFSIVFKLPFVLYYLVTRKKILSKFLVSTLILISFLVIIILNSRGAFIGAFIVLLIFFFSIFFLKTKLKFKSRFIKSSFIIIPIIFSILLSNKLLSSQSENMFYNRASTISLSTKDGSVNQRLRYYKDALSSISKNLIFGVGIGNWKLKSIEYDKDNIAQYIIPYHAHNDYLQVGAESGVLAMIFYILIFMVIFLMLYNLYLKDREDLFFIMVFSSIIIYLLDSALNFPIARPINQLSLILSFALIVNLSRKEKVTWNFNNYYKIMISIILLFFSSTAIYSSYKNYDSLIDQNVLYLDYNGETNYLSTKNIHLIQESFPNLTVSVLPINEMKAIYSIREEKYEEAIKKLNKKNLNPYLGFRENQIAQAYQGLKMEDSVYKYIKIAFYKLPNNESHSTQYFNILRKRKDLDEINNVFNIINLKTPIVWKAYLNAKSEVVGPGNKEMKKTIDSLIKVYPKDKSFKEISKFIRIGKENFANSLATSVIADRYFKNKEYNKAIDNYLEAIELDPYEFSYHENLAISYQKLGDKANAYKYFDIVIDSLNPKTGKSEFYKGVNLIQDKENEKGCILLKKSLNYGFSGAKNVIENFCN